MIGVFRRMDDIIFGLDIGTTKICALVGAVRAGQLQIIGLGVEPFFKIAMSAAEELRNPEIYIRAVLGAE